MKRTIWLTIALCLVGLTTSNSLFAHGGHGGGGGGHAGGGGGGGHVGGGAPAHMGGVTHSFQGGGQPSFSHSPGVAHSNMAIQSSISGSPQVGHHPGFNNGLQSNFNAPQSGGINIQHHPGHIQTGNFQQNNIGHLGGVQGNAGLVNAGQHGIHNINNLNGVGVHGINHNNFVGNSVNIGNRNINVANVSYRPAYFRHGGLYHGYWNANRAYIGYGYGGYGWGPGFGFGLYGYRPYFWGLGGWGLGSLVYGSGYLGYSNPYYIPAYAGLGYNYNQPIPVSYNPNVSNFDPNATNRGNSAGELLSSAVAAFKQNNYDAALDLANQGITLYPDDAVIHEFRALVLFARSDYQQAATTIHAVLAVGPGWDWTTLSGLYNDVGLYTGQLRALEGFVKQNPQDAAGRFLLAYHYMSDGYPDAAVKQLQKVVALVPNDMVAANLLKMTSAPQAPAQNDPNGLPMPQQPVDIPSPTQSNAPAIDPSAIVGNWSASRDDGSRFALTLTGDKKFTWSFSPNQQPPQSFDGTYSVEGNVLALERTGGGSLLAEIRIANGGGFNFKMVGAPNEDPGLNFAN